ncbi:hypothetical protein [Nonomuraea sp. NPDC003214]
MRALILILAVALICASIPAAYLTARWILQRLRDQRDLIRQRAFVEHLHQRALEHQQLGDHFAVIVTDDIRHFTSTNSLPEGTTR